MTARRRPRSWFACGEGCDFQAPLTDVVYRCPRCGGLLDVEHDVARLARRSGAAWRARFDEARGPSGVWAKKEWVYPDLPERDVVTLGEGNSPLLAMQRYGAALGLKRFWLKQCGVSATGSFKDLGMTVLVSAVRRMRAAGRPIRAVVCASTGDTSAAVSAYCAAAGIPAVVFLPRGKVSPSQLVQPLSNGALVLALDGDFDACMRVVQEVTADPGLYLANSLNPLRLEGQKTVAVELCQQLGWRVPDWVVIPGGNLGNAAALGRGFELMLRLGLVRKRPRIAVAQAARANPFVQAFRSGFSDLSPIVAGGTLATAIQIGNPVSLQRAIRALEAFDGVVEDATEPELADAAARADRDGAFCCPQTGVALAVAQKLVAQKVIQPGSEVAVISTAHGLKFAEVKQAYHASALAGVSPRWPNPPVQVPATTAAVQQVLRDRLDRPGVFG